ncbi:MAG TPA: hypothetical protein VL947_04765, partial [Cytophagales bacterium]|nr:hypothetical protein [Cytophagales bacterium]
LDFDKSALENHNLIRGLSPYPGAYFVHQDKSYKVYKSAVVQGKEGKDYFNTDHKSYVYLRCGDGNCLSILEIQPEGKKRMDIADFLRGNKI